MAVATGACAHIASESSAVLPSYAHAFSHASAIRASAPAPSNAPALYMRSSSPWNRPPTRKGMTGLRGASPFMYEYSYLRGHDMNVDRAELVSSLSRLKAFRPLNEANVEGMDLSIPA